MSMAPLIPMTSEYVELGSTRGHSSGYVASNRAGHSDPMDAPMSHHEHAYVEPGSPGMASQTSTNAILNKEAMLLEARDMDNIIEEEPTSRVRRWWVRMVVLCTWWIPSIALSKVGRMKRPDVQMAWREKVTICALIFFACAFILFYILVFGKLICPDMNKAWNTNQLSEHVPPDSFYVAVRGKVYDISKFWRLQHSDSESPASNDVMTQMAGLDLTPYFPVPLTIGCPTLVTDDRQVMTQNTSSLFYSPSISQAIHKSGTSGDPASKLSDPRWYPDRFLPFMQRYYKGYFVTSKKDLEQGSGDRQWAIIDNKVYDLGDYMYTNSLQTNVAAAKFLPEQVSNLFGQTPGQDITADFRTAMAGLNESTRAATQNCLDNVFYAGLVDFRETPRCQVQNYLLLSFSIVLVGVMVMKFLAALQLAPKRHPEQQDKFVICQVPCYTEGEEELRKTIDSLAALQYDDKRKLLFLICDGMIIGDGNDQPTPRIVLDILGVDPKVDAEPQMFKSVAEGSKQLNYGKVYSGLYEFEGHVVPYIVVVKVGRISERKRPGNRGKRDTQILLMRYLNRVHFNAPMYPLELEIYHHMKNIIGIDPAFYEYILMVDADTTVESDGLNRLVSVAADDSRVIAVCGETRLYNEESSWWTMIQVYEYFISHHLAKAFESLFGSVTCLPGCFSMYRIRSADKGRPLIISDRIIDDYSENRVDTLHKKNLLSLGEDRYLTTLILKHFPAFSTKFTSDAKAQTTAPDQWAVLLSQRRRWINSTIHNLAELVTMPELCGFCLLSMRFIVFVDLLGTIILPATTVYLVYLIIVVATQQSAIPYISLGMLGAVYGLQMLIFLLKRQWQYIGWLVVYLLAYPIWSFFLPIYSFWHMDDFSWGNTRIVVGEKGNKKIIAGTDDEPYDDSMLPLKRFSDYEKELQGGKVASLRPADRVSLRSRQSTLDVPAPFQDSSSVYSQSRGASEFGGGSLWNDNRDESHRNVSHPATHSGIGGARQMDEMRTMMAMSPMPFSSNQSPGSYMTHSQSLYNMPRAPVPSMYGMQMMMPHGQSTTTIYNTPAPSMLGFPMGGSMIGMSSPAGGYPTGQMYAGSQNPSRAPSEMVASHSTGGSWTAAAMTATSPMQPGSSVSRSASQLEPDPSDDERRTVVLPVNPSSNPTDEDIVDAVRSFLARQPDLMKVSKRDVRQAIVAAFPNAPIISVSKAKVSRAVDEVLASIA